MLPPDILTANFTISENAKSAIEDIRRDWNARFDDPAAAVMVGWGLFSPYSGPPFEDVIVSFYGQSQLSGIASALQTVSGLDVIFFTTPEHHHHFEGKVLDYEPERWFFLRSP
jgi:hypothetical protein